MRKKVSLSALLVVVGVLLCLYANALDVGRAIRAVETQGYIHAEVVDRAWLFVGLRGCSEDDLVRHTVLATNPRGARVFVYVCTGAFKGSTIRVP